MPRPIRQFLDTTGQHQRNVPTQDANGGSVAAYSTINANVKFSLQPIDSETRDTYSRRDIVVTHALIFDTDLDAKPRDRISVGTTYYVVVGIEPAASVGIFPHPVYSLHCERRVN